MEISYVRVCNNYKKIYILSQFVKSEKSYLRYLISIRKIKHINNK